MKRWLLLTFTVIIVATLAATARNHVKSVAQEKREIAYRSVLLKYSGDLTPGLRRQEAEIYLRARGANFSWTYTGFGERHESQYADLVKIGEETALWYSNAAYVYIAFEFSGTEKYKQNDADVLKRIEIFRPYSGCL